MFVISIPKRHESRVVVKYIFREHTILWLYMIFCIFCILFKYVKKLISTPKGKDKSIYLRKIKNTINRKYVMFPTKKLEYKYHSRKKQKSTISYISSYMNKEREYIHTAKYQKAHKHIYYWKWKYWNLVRNRSKWIFIYNFYTKSRFPPVYLSSKKGSYIPYYQDE